MDCKRSMDCTCPQCAAASAEFSVEDLKQFSSSIDYGAAEEGAAEPGGAFEPTPKPKPKVVQKRKTTPKPFPKSTPQAAEASSIPATELGADAPPPPPPAAAPGADEEDHEDGPLEARLASKNWKTRKAAYQQMQGLFEVAKTGDDPVFSQYASFLKDMVQDSNASCLDVALEASLTIADTYAHASRLSSELAPGIVAKGLSGRPGTVGKAEAVLLKLMEVDTPEVVVGVLLEGLSDKKPKVPPACVSILTKAIQMFGPRAMPLKDIKMAMPGMLSHKVVAVRPQAISLAAEIVSWCGESILASVISELRSAQKSELESLVREKAEASPGPRAPTHHLRKDRPSETDQVAGKVAAEHQAFDPRDFVEPVDILSKLPKTDFHQKLAAAKWSEILEGLNIAVDLIGPVPKLTAGDYGELVQKLKRLGDHSHVQVASTSHRLLALLAEGLRSGFQPYYKSVLGAMLLKLKDKKCVAVVGSCLDKVYGNPYSLDQAVDEVVAALESKRAIHSRLAALEWICRCLARSTPSVETATLVAMARGTIRLVDDSDPKIREAGSATLAAIATASSRGAKGPAAQVWAVVLELQTSNVRAFKKIRDQVETTGSGATHAAEQPPIVARGASVSGKGGKAAPSAASKSAPGSRVNASQMESSEPSVRARVAPRGNTKPATKAKAAPVSAAGQGRAPAASLKERGDGGDDGTDEPFTMSLEEAMDKLESMAIEEWEGSVVPGLSGTAWKEKVASIESISQGGLSDPEQYLGPVVLVVAAHTKQFKDSNFNVLKVAFNGIKVLLESGVVVDASRANRAAVAIVISPAVEKLGDRKLQETTASLLTSASESLGPSWVVRRVMKAAAQAKAPLVHSEALGWLHSCVKDFGAGLLPVPQLVAFATSELEHVNPKVRSSSLELLGSLYHRLGPPLKALLPVELRPSLQSQVDDTFNKVGYDPTANAQATRKAVSAGRQNQDGSEAGGGGLPRVDLSSLLEKDCLARMQCIKGKDAWKGRKAAIEEVIQACAKSGNHLEANKFVVDIVKALTPRLGDSQSNLKPLAASALAEVAASVPLDSAIKLTRIYAEPLLACVADNRKMMRDAAIAAFEKVTSSGDELHIPAVEALIGPVVVAMANVVGRIELLTWLKGVVPRIPAGEGPTSLVSPLLACMQDKNAGARQLAQECLSGLIAAGTVQPSRVRAGTRDFQPAVMRQLKPALEKILETSGPGTADTRTSDAVGNPTTDQTATPVVVSKLVRSGPAVVAPSGNQHKRPARPGMSQKAESASEAMSSSPTASAGPLLSTNTKAKRLESEKRTRWFVSSDEPRDHQITLLKTLWSPLLKPDAVDILFPVRVGSMECGSPGMELLSCALRDQQVAFMDVLDLVFKWISLRLCEKENVKAMGQLLQLLGETLDTLVAMQYRLEDLEVDALLPTLLEKSGQAKERFRTAIRGLLTKVPLLCSYAKYCPLLLQATASKNSRTRVACLLELSRCVEEDGLANVLGRKGLKELARHVDSDQAEVRSAALDVVESCYISLDMDSARIHRLLGSVNDKTKTLVEERIKAAVRKIGKAPAATGDTNDGGPRDAGDPVSGLDRQRKVEQTPVSPAAPPADEEVGYSAAASWCTPARPADAHVDRSHRASLGGLEDDSSLGDVGLGTANSSSPEADGDLFQFDCNDLEVVLSPRSREREAGNTASETAFWALLKEVETGLLQHPSLDHLLPGGRAAAMDQIKGLANWATAQSGTKGGEALLSRHHSRLIMTLVRCLRLSFTGGVPVAVDDLQYAGVAGTGGIDVELAPLVVSALDDVCNASAYLFDAESLAAMLREVCHWLVEQRLGPHAHHEKYKTCDPYGQVQQKLNRMATLSGAASLSVAIAALCDVMASAHASSVERKATNQVPKKGRRSVETKLLKVYVKLLARLSKAYDQGKIGGSDRGQGGFGSVSLPLVLRALHKYHMAEQMSSVLDLDEEEYRAYEGSTSIVKTVCEQLQQSWGGSALRSSVNSIRDEHRNSESGTTASEDAWRKVLSRCKAATDVNNTPANQGTGAESAHHHSSPVLAVKLDHVAEIARLIGLVSAESQRERDGSAEDDAGALKELKSYLHKWPDAYATLGDQKLGEPSGAEQVEWCNRGTMRMRTGLKNIGTLSPRQVALEQPSNVSDTATSGTDHLFNNALYVQVDRLKPRFRQFILDGCRGTDGSGTGVQSTPSRGRTPVVQGSWSSARRGQDLEIARKSLAFEADENTLRSESRTLEGAQAKDDGFPTHSDRLQEIRRRMGGLGSREQGTTRTGSSSADGNTNIAFSVPAQGRNNIDRPQPLKQTNNFSTTDIQERLRAVTKPPDQGSEDNHSLAGAAIGRTSVTERFRRRNG